MTTDAFVFNHRKTFVLIGETRSVKIFASFGLSVIVIKFVQTEKEKDKTKQDGKTSVKGVFRGLQASPSSACGLYVSMHMANKEKKQKSKWKVVLVVAVFYKWAHPTYFFYLLFD